MRSGWCINFRLMELLGMARFMIVAACSHFSPFHASSDRVCIKIPVTPESVLACQQLEKDGIRTLGTCLFSVPQALAASQAGCLYVAPYFNGPYHHHDFPI